MALANRLAIIVGGLGGLGSATGKVLRSQGAKLALFYAPAEKDRVEQVLSDTYGSGAKGDEIKTYMCDITAPSSVQEAFQSVRRDDTAFPSILINTAGHVNLTPLEETTPEDMMLHYNINLLGPTLTGQAFARIYFDLMNENSPGGRIVNVASQAAHVALLNHGAYCASKAGLIGLTRCMASEWGSRGITANSVSPGPVFTALGKKAWADPKAREEYLAGVPTGNFAEPEEVAHIISFLCQDTSLNISGTDIRLDGGYTAR